jgi:branched-chain amino acid transport system ATP-binding protein
LAGVPVKRDMSPILDVQGISQSFGGLRAVDNASFTANDNEITSLIGPNGAGKTTIFNIISGFLPRESGTILFRGQPIDGLKPFERARSGIGRTFQDPRVFPDMTVLENVMVGIRLKGERPLWALVRGGAVNAEWRRARERSEAILATVGLIDRAKDLARDLSFGEQRFLSIARSLVGDPAIILMDEPTVGLDRNTFTKLLDLMTRLVQVERKALLVIEHNMDVVMSVSAKVVLLVQGTAVASGTPEEIKLNRSMVEAYLGRKHVASSN